MLNLEVSLPCKYSCGSRRLFRRTRHYRKLLLPRALIWRPGTVEALIVPRQCAGRLNAPLALRSCRMTGRRPGSVSFRLPVKVESRHVPAPATPIAADAVR